LSIGCTEEIRLVKPGEPIPVVYCLLNPDLKEQYVRLGRTFILDPTDTANSLITDSTVWDLPVDVYIEECLNDQPIAEYRFEPCDAPVKDSGLFSLNNLRLYRGNFKPSRSTTYRLYVHFPDSKMLVYGSTNIPDKPIIHDPLPLPGRKINLQSEVNYTVRWTPDRSVGLYQCLFYVTYQEEINHELSFHEILFGTDPVLETTKGSLLSWTLSGNRFIQEVVSQVPINGNATRKIINVQFRFFSGGEELALQSSPDILAGAMSPLNPFTNLLNGIGIFSSIQTLTVDNLELSNTTLIELANGELTRNLGFIYDFGSDIDNCQ